MYVVTGATGNTGSVIVNRLLAKGQKVRAMGRNADRLKSLAAKGAEPFVADLAATDALVKAFIGAKAAYVMIPPDLKSQDYRAYQDRLSDAVANAIEKSRIRHLVNLSSLGADKSDNTGPVVGLRRFEQKLNRIPGLNVLHLRPGYFMENTLIQVPLIKAFGMAAGPLRSDLKLPMIAALDIGVFAADALLKLDFSNQETRELLGQRDITMTEATAIIGQAIGKPDLKYAQMPDDQVRAGMAQSGLSLSISNLILEMAGALNSGYMHALEPRTARNTTPTSYETFVTEEFVPAYQSAAAA
jgi:uncharacterized protein YbjT (DUF2867 family)